MKNGSKTISERTTRFLPVDMKDRLKSAFNRNSANPTAPENPNAEDGPDYTATVNANRSAAAASQIKPNLNGPLLNGPLGQGPLAEAGSRSAARQVARNLAADIEEAEIVVERIGPATNAKAPTIAASSNEVADYSIIAESDKSNAMESKPARRQIDLTDEVEPSLPEGSGQDGSGKEPPRSQDELEALSDKSKREEAVSQKSRSRFFGDFSSTESVRLKIEKRNDKRPPEPPMRSVGSQHPHPNPIPAEVNTISTEPGAAPVFAFEADPHEQLTEVNREVSEPIAVGPTTSEQANINLQQEFDSMDANGQESENGASAPTDGGGNVAAITIERNSKFSGQLKFSGAVTIAGQVEGELFADRVVVQEGGVVNASVEGDMVTIAGTVKGDIRAHSELEILASGIVDGSVTAPSINVRRGGRVEGRCKIGVPRE